MSSNPSASPSLEKDDLTRCTNLYWHLMYCLEAKLPGHQYIHHLQKSASCDHIYNMRPVRDSIEAKVGSDNFKEVMNFSQDPRIQAQVQEAVEANYTLTNAELYKALPLWGKFNYHTLFRWDRWISSFDRFEGAGGKFKVYRRMAKKK